MYKGRKISGSKTEQNNSSLSHLRIGWYNHFMALYHLKKKSNNDLEKWSLNLGGTLHGPGEAYLWAKQTVLKRTK